MPSNDDKIFKKLKESYYEAKAKNDYTHIQRIANQGFKWLIEYTDQKISRHKGAMLRRTNAYKQVRGMLMDEIRSLKYDKQKTKENKAILRILEQIDDKFWKQWHAVEKIEKDLPTWITDLEK